MSDSPNASLDRVMSPLNFVIKLNPGAKAGIEKASRMMEAQLKKGADAIRGTAKRFSSLPPMTAHSTTTSSISPSIWPRSSTSCWPTRTATPPLPIAKNPQEFADWVRARDLQAVAHYSAYPKLTVQDIQAMEAKLAS